MRSSSLITLASSWSVLLVLATACGDEPGFTEACTDDADCGDLRCLPILDTIGSGGACISTGASRCTHTCTLDMDCADVAGACVDQCNGVGVCM